VSASGADVAVTIVAYESERTLGACLDALAAQVLSPREVVVVDNASADGSAALARRHAVVSRVESNAGNVGFAAGQNQAIRATRSPWVLVLNPDAVLEPRFLAELASRTAGDRPRLGTLCGKLRRLGSDLSRPDPPRIDCAGMVFTREFRHLDRGSGEVDRGQFEREEVVFGASGAAALYRRAMIDDVAIEGEFFDEAFFAYREDADVAWRAQLLGWDCLYVPTAVGYHVRRVVPERRRELPAMLNRHSVTNRFLMRIKNADAAVWRRCGARGLARDAAVVAGCLVREWSSLPAFADLARLWPRALRQRREIQGRRRRGGAEVARWFA
jgi:GT2 family glycosyltransferase